MVVKKEINCSDAYKMLLNRKVDDLDTVEMVGIDAESGDKIIRVTAGIKLSDEVFVTPEGVFKVEYEQHKRRYIRLCSFGVEQRRRLAEHWYDHFANVVKNSVDNDKFRYHVLMQSHGDDDDDRIIIITKSHLVSLKDSERFLLNGVLSYNSPYLNIALFVIVTKKGEVIIQATRIGVDDDSPTYYYVVNIDDVFEKYASE
ncbi:MAG: hypothetical protein QXQ91_03500 [Nanopusillaceae archaeon]